MKAKTIKAVLRKKIDDWLESIEDEEVRKLAAKNTIITGGSIASMLLREQVNDFDIYFRNYETAFKITRYYLSKFAPKVKRGITCRIYMANDYGAELKEFSPPGDDPAQNRIKIIVKSAGIANEDGTDKPYEYFESGAINEDAGAYVGEVMDGSDDPEALGDIQEKHDELEGDALLDDGKPKYRPVFVSTNAITLSNRIQIVIRFWGEPDQIHENYDYVHCMNYWTSWDDKLMLRPESLESLLSRELRYIGSKYPICSLIRVRKFLKRGWTINAGQMLKMTWQISELDLKSVKVLEDQLTGVDVAYFGELIGKLKEKDPEKVNAAYLVEIIDRMF